MATRNIEELNYTVVFEPTDNGAYTVTVPALPGCFSEGNTLEEARANAKEAIACYLESLQKDGEAFPPDIDTEPLYEKVSVALHS